MCEISLSSLISVWTIFCAFFSNVYVFSNTINMLFMYGYAYCSAAHAWQMYTTRYLGRRILKGSNNKKLGNGNTWIKDEYSLYYSGVRPQQRA